MKPKLEYASHGPFVAEAQTKLNALMPGLPPLKVDGKYGEKCVGRVKQFQKSRGLVADGLVGAKTWAALDGTAPAPGAPGKAPATPPKPGLPLLKGKGVKVYRGARMKCNLGTSPSLIMPFSPDGLATVGDCKPYSNFMPFGKCSSFAHPSYIEPTTYQDPFMEDVVFTYGSSKMRTPMCTPVIVAPWNGGGKDSAQVIDKSATCLCKYGGTIHFA